MALRFGSSSLSWPVSNADFNVGAGSRDSMCVGGFIALNTSGTTTPAFIVGDTFLKNVYSVFRAEPPSVGFAALSDTANAMNGALGPIPTPTFGSVAATVNGHLATHGVSSTNGGVRAEPAVAGLVSILVLLSITAGFL